ncbi:diguanylate cyclase (GGDEF)-like protein [Motilibacter peucedani]|uniref:Diguanylate cyclase (GGDEF)-like protein n=1 Tax=Motilibacter peucedani TaxID=598650 RepID=A0A420XLU0_9ACTN|nr:EAL domain-containing protein [Motilibacter peucedani]RKS71383.1 diguanylate cyclase (GGDEF)-like protein [Motilibacter peucedani]
MTRTGSPARTPWVAHLYAALLLGVGAAALVVHPPRFASLWVLLGVVVVPVLARFPLTILRQSAGIDIQLDSVVLLFLGFAAPGAALPVWALGSVLAQVWVTGRPVAVRVINVGLCLVAGTSALAAVELVPHSREAGPLGVAAAALAGLAYFAADYAGSALGVVLLGRVSLREAFWDETAGLVAACAGGVAALGYLGAVVLRHEPWAFPLVTVPIATVVFAGYAYARTHEERLRVRALFDGAASLQGARTAEDVHAAVLEAGRGALRTHDVSLVLPGAAAGRPAGAPPGGLVALLPAPEAGGAGSLVAGERRSREPYTADDAHTLDLLASLAAESLRRVGQVSELEQLAGHDTLTGLLNARSFRAALELALPSRPAVLYCDLDGFKEVNDTLGHDAGDEVLRTVAGRLRGCLRPDDSLGRMGGDEFAVVLPGVDRAEAEAVAARILDALRPSVPIGQVDAHVGVSVGVAEPADGTPAAELVRQADIAMYAAKSAGKSQWVVCTPEIYARQVSRQVLGDQLRGAAARGELVLHYQPVVGVVSGRLAGVEAHVRWAHPQLGLLEPEAFVPLAEETGLVDELTRWVLATATAAAPRLSEAAGQVLPLGIDVSPASVARGVVAEAVARGARPGQELVLELPENALGDPRTVSALEELRRRGVRVAVDCFGTGTLSLVELRTLPFDAIKLDPAISAGLAHEPATRRLVGAVVELAHALGKPLVLGGVEDAASFAAARELGFNAAQGPHLGAAVPQDELDGLLTAQRRAEEAVAG